MQMSRRGTCIRWKLDASVTIRPLIPTPAQRVSNICAETDVLQRGKCVRAISGGNTRLSALRHSAKCLLDKRLLLSGCA
jgi:hypothetical protein